jgi:predicted GNAT family acetyltransferase
MSAPPAPEIRHLPEAGRFEAVVDGVAARLDYRLDGRTLRLERTFVPPELEGRGIASALVQAAVDHARANGLSIEPVCSYVQAWLKRRPQHQDLVAR